MHWQDQGFLLSARRHGETSAILEVFTRSNGRHCGLLRGGASRKTAAALQPGTQLTVEWRARLPEHLGVFRIEPVRSRAAPLFRDRLALAALSSSCSLLTRILPEREPADLFYERTLWFLDLLEGGGEWMPGYLQWELQLLREAGRGLDLSRCALTGADQGLRYVSPRSGAAVCADAAGDWAPRLLEIPPCLVGGEFGGINDYAAGLKLTGHFLNAVLSETNSPERAMAARRRLEDLTSRMSRSERPD